MAPKEPNRHQLSSRLSYNQSKPAFLQKLENRIAGVPDEDDFDEFEDDGSGRPPIPRRPAIPERPYDDPGSSDEDDGDEKPQVVVLKEGKHLTEREAGNIRRKEKGLPPLPDPAVAVALLNTQSAPSGKEVENSTNNQASGLSFSSSKGGFKSSTGKRKAVGDLDDPKHKKAANGSTKKKAKKTSKSLLSFGDDA